MSSLGLFASNSPDLELKKLATQKQQWVGKKNKQKISRKEQGGLVKEKSFRQWLLYYN